MTQTIMTERKRLKYISTARDGGTRFYLDMETNQTVCVDHRIKTDTPGRLYFGYPERDNSNLIEDKELLHIYIEELRPRGL